MEKGKIFVEQRERDGRLPGTIYPSKLREARQARGYSVTDLVDLINVSRATITKYEAGTVSPSLAILQRYSEGLDFPHRYFMIPNNVNEAINSPMLFRAQAAVTAAEKEMVVIRGEWMGRICDYLEHRISFPEVEIPRSYARDTPFAPEEIESIAEAIRQQWGLGDSPISNITLLLQDKGALIARVPTNLPKADASSFWRGNRPYFLLFTEKASAVRSRFDAAHELGHRILHNIQPGDEKKRTIVARLDEEANRFAGAFLLPQRSFARELISTSLDHFLYLKKRWKVAIAAMIYRCKDLNILSESQIAYLWRQRTIQGWRFKEPLDDVLQVEQPTMISDALSLLKNNGHLSLKQIKETFEYPDEDLEAFFNLPCGAFLDGEIKRPKLFLVQ